MEPCDVCHHLWVGSFDVGSHLINVLQEFRELVEDAEEGSDHNDSESLAPSISSESLDDKLESNVLKDSVEELVFDNSSEEFSNLCQILWRVPV